MRVFRTVGPGLRLVACVGAIVLLAAGSSPGEQFRITARKAKTVALPGGFAGLADPSDDSLYSADIGLGEAFSFPVVYDTGASGSLLSEWYASTLGIPETGETYEDVGIGGTETFDVSEPTRLLLAPASIGEGASETRSYYTTVGDYKFQIRQSDPVVSLMQVIINIVGTPVLNQYVMHVQPNNVSYSWPFPPIDYMDSYLLPSMPSFAPSEVLRVPLEYQAFVEPGAPVDVADNPMIPDVRVVDDRRAPNDQSAPSDWLLDTGGSVTIVGEDLAAEIGIDVVHETPVASVEVLGVGNEIRTFYGYMIDELILNLTGNDELIFEDIVVFVPETGSLPVDLPGIFGMNLIGQSFNVVDPFFGPVDTIDSPFEDWYVDYAGSELVLGYPHEVPEPSSLSLLAVFGLLLVMGRRRITRRAK